MAFETLRGAVGGALQQKLFDQTQTGQQGIIGKKLQNRLAALKIDQQFPLFVEQLKKQIDFMISPVEEKEIEISAAREKIDMQGAEQERILGVQEGIRGRQLEDIQTFQSEQAKLDRESREKIAGMRGDGIDGQKVQFSQTIEGKKFAVDMSKFANEISKDFGKVDRNMVNINQAAQRLIDDPKISRIAVDEQVITSYKKILDPDSVVRESEFARTEISQALLDKIRNWDDRLTKGATLTKENLLEIREVAAELHEWRRRNVNQKIDDQVRTQLEGTGLDPDTVAPLFPPLEFKGGTELGIETEIPTIEGFTTRQKVQDYVASRTGGLGKE
ncbi:MAG: hypothetical protein KAS32_04320 [Candidatus Peribacteraceae bacterium]|nr:hypothetical protein [Candidatus Peribacteraceae bacterium]